MRQIDVSKIYVDEQGIRTAGQVVLEESFRRYKEMASLSSIETLRMLDPERLRLIHVDEQGQMVATPISKAELATANLKVVTTAQFVLFKELFLDVRDRFISSGEHGLDAYLSVRIRHGVLQNQIRSPFETLHLIAEKDTNTGNYLEIQYWNARSPEISSDKLGAIQKHLATFSQKVDDSAQQLNKVMVQVKTERKNPNGLFDYTFSDAVLFEYFSSQFATLTEATAFLDGIFQLLWKRTGDNLERIRTVISGSIKDEISESLGHLESEVRGLVEPQQAPELMRNIASCQTSLQYELDKIAQWFTISGSNLVSRFSIDELLNICVQSINNIYPHKRVEPTVLSTGNVTLDGKYFPHFSDIVRTLLDNILTHSGVQPEQMGLEIDAKADSERLQLSLKNNLAENVRLSDPVSRLNFAHKNLGSADISEVIVREGGSGLLKVQKIMTSDLHRKDPSLQFSYASDGKFVVTLRMDLEGLIYEDSADRG